MRDLEEMFSETLFLGAGKGVQTDVDRLWMIAEHLHGDETALAFVSLKTSNLLLTEKRLVELKPHLDIEGFWNVLSFKGYRVKREVYLREILAFDLETGRGERGALHIQVGDEKVVFPIPLSEGSEDPQEDLDLFGSCLGGALKGRARA